MTVVNGASGGGRSALTPVTSTGWKRCRHSTPPVGAKDRLVPMFCPQV